MLLARCDPLIDALRALAQRHAALPMLARTHGQTASPTTLGKEFANVVARLERARAALGAASRSSASGTAPSATSTRTVAAVPGGRLARAVAAASSSRCGLAWNPHTTQIEPHDWIGEYCDALAAIDVILHRPLRATSGATSVLGYLRQRPVAGEVGSSTMPHKINPIDFENGEGNLGVANRAAAPFRRQAAGLALAARPHRLHGAAQPRRRARPLR